MESLPSADTIANLLTAGNMIGAMIFLGIGWLIKIIFARMREFFDRSETEDAKNALEIARAGVLRRDTDRDLYQLIAEVRVEIAGLLGERKGYKEGMAEARESARFNREFQGS